MRPACCDRGSRNPVGATIFPQHAMDNNLEKGIAEEQMRLQRIRKVRTELNNSKHLLLQESFGGNAGRSGKGRLQAGLNVFVHRITGDFVYAGNNPKKEVSENPDLGSVIFYFEIGENSDFESGQFIDVRETHIGAQIIEEVMDIFKEAVGRKD